MTTEYLFAHLGVSLAIGLLIGAERGWHDRELGEGRRVAGLRTFGLIGLAGGLSAVLSTATLPWVLPVALLGLALILGAAYLRQSEQTGSVGTTTVIAALATFLLGALPLLGMIKVAAGGAVVTALLLGMKPRLHALIRKMEEADLLAGLRLLLISVVVLPVLPDKGYGPGGALNPFEIWWMVVLIAAISFSGYLAIKILGPKRGVGVTALLGGLVSSTAVTVSLSRLTSSHRDLARDLGGGVVLASTAMFPRMAVIVGIVAPAALAHIAVPVMAMALAGALCAGILLARAKETESRIPTPQNPLQLQMALSFGVVLAFVMLISQLVSDRFGDAGLYTVAAISGVADVDAMTLTAGRMAGEEIEAAVAGRAIIIAALVNTAAKGVIYMVLASKGRIPVAASFVAVLAAGGSALLLT